LPAEQRIEAAFRTACEAELAALKPGNVHRYGDGHGMTVADFQRSAAAAAPHLAGAGSAVGARILAATEATWAAVGCNTNLGIVLLCAPLAVAAEQAFAADGQLAATALAAATRTVVETLTLHDAELAYRAIAKANPGGLGTASAEDVRNAPTVTLRRAMELAAAQDRIAHQYASGFADLFAVALPWLRHALATGRDEATATSGLFLTLLGRWPDSHLLRKFGDSTAQSVSAEARRFADLYAGMAWPILFHRLLDWDGRLKASGLNPGSSADLTVATLFAHHLLSD
jgi:triphosphoribosyl-dephospho-CoA synthase